VFGTYHVKKKLGGGGMGTVYLVENTELRRDEALKVPHFEADDPQARERFLREARAAAGLDHPNLCPVYHVGVQDGVHFLTMRYLQGRPLSDYTARPQPPRKAVEIVTKLARALEYAHGKDVIHRDLKPSNVMMCAGVGPVVLDFGLAKQTRQPDRKLTQFGARIGTPAYMPPEQVKGDLDRIGPASDVYSLGVILWELLTGQPLLRGSLAEVFGKILYADRPSPSSLRPGLSPALDAICLKALAKAPEQRYASMKAFGAALMDYLRAAPATEGTEKLVPSKAVQADILQLPTVPPGQAPPAGTVGRGRSVPAATLVAPPLAAPARKSAGAPWDGRPWGVLAGILGCLGLVLVAGALIGLGMGGLGALSHRMPPSEPLAVADTAASRPSPAETMQSTASPAPPTDTAPASPAEIERSTAPPSATEEPPKVTEKTTEKEPLKGTEKTADKEPTKGAEKATDKEPPTPVAGAAPGVSVADPKEAKGPAAEVIMQGDKGPPPQNKPADKAGDPKQPAAKGKPVPNKATTLSGSLTSKSKIDPSRPGFYCNEDLYNLKAGRPYTVAVAAEFAADVRVEDPKGNVVAQETDHVPPALRRISQTRFSFTPQVDGDYQVIVSTASPGTRGAFQFQIKEGSDAGGVRPAP
jgi:predicted Ser/Thr protein kinase